MLVLLQLVYVWMRIEEEKHNLLQLEQLLHSRVPFILLLSPSLIVELLGGWIVFFTSSFLFFKFRAQNNHSRARVLSSHIFASAVKHPSKCVLRYNNSAALVIGSFLELSNIVCVWKV